MRWINRKSVEPPREDGIKILASGNGLVYECFWDGNDWCSFTHWMPHPGTPVSRKTNSGHMNIVITQAGTYCVVVSQDHLGTFKDLEVAIGVRDSYRAKLNLKPAAY